MDGGTDRGTERPEHEGGLATPAMAASATLHCLTGCATGEIVGMLLAAAWGLGSLLSVAISFGLAFVFGYTLSSVPLLRAGVALTTALSLVLAADTVSILTMEVVDNGVIALVPGALDAGLGDVLFWVTMAASLVVAFAAALPVNARLLRRGRGHALTHDYLHAGAEPEGLRRWVPDVGPVVLASLITAFLLGGLVAAAAG